MDQDNYVSPRILCVGLMCLDIVNFLDRYPEEDEDIRAKHQLWQSGGNSNNTAKVLALIGRQSEFFGSLGTGMETDFGVARLDSLGVSHNYCPIYEESRLPTSYIVLNTTNGSRTIIHYRNIPELCLQDFLDVDLVKYGWIHFEGRNPVEYSKMIKHIQEYNQLNPSKPVIVSVEIEKKKPELMDFVPLVDVLIMSKDFAKYHGLNDKIEAVTQFHTKVKRNAVVVCPWGEQGAAAIDKDGKVYSSPAFSPSQVVDTLGAGDTFNAGLIHALSNGLSLENAVNFGCKLAGSKCGMLGYDGLRVFKCKS